MKIAMVAPFEESVPPQKYGGTEIVVYNLVTELQRLGHEVTLYATGDSKVPCTLVSVFPESIRVKEPFASDTKTRDMAKFVGISKVIGELQKEHFDIIHNHIGWRFTMFSHLFSPPVVTTLHGPPGEIYQKFIQEQHPKDHFISISNNQRKSFPELPYAATVYNGIDLSLYPYKEKPDGDYLLFLARFSPEKGVKEAIEIARKANKQLIMAVKIDAVDKTYYESLRPLLEESHVQLVGEVGMEDKIKLLQNAQALVAPIQWEEPFGLYAVEAMACGTPVLGIARGAFPEIISNGINGFLSDTVDGLVSVVSQLGTIHRDQCRRSVEEKFTMKAMGEGYLAAYENIIALDSKMQS